MEMTQELLTSALDALMDQSLTLAQEYRMLASKVDDPEVADGLRGLADLHSRRLTEASELAQLIRAHGVAELEIFQ